MTTPTGGVAGPQTTPSQTQTEPSRPKRTIRSLSDVQGRLSWPDGGSPIGYELDGTVRSVGTEDRVGTVSMAGRPRPNAISNRLYYDSSNFHVARIQTSADFDRMTGVAGINDETACPQNTAIVHVEDESGRTLWGPRIVRIDSPIGFSIDLHRAIQVDLVSEVTRANSAGGGDPCSQGDPDPAWGNVKFIRLRRLAPAAGP